MTTSAEVQELVRSWAAAEQANDRTALAPLLAPDFVGVGPLGFVLGHDQWLVRFDTGLRNSAFAVEEPHVRVFGDAAAVVGVLAQQTTFNGQDNSGRFRITLMAVRGDGGWQLAGAHIGTLHNPADGPPRPPGGTAAVTGVPDHPPS